MKFKFFTILSILTVFTILSILTVSAGSISCDKSSVQTNYIQGTSPSTSQVICNNAGGSSVNVVSSGNYFTSDTSFILGNNSRTITLTFSSSAPVGTNIGSLTFSDGSQSIPIVMTVNSSVQSGCSIGASLLSYSQAVSQNTQFAIPKITFSPVNCVGQLSLSASSVNIQGGVVTSSGQKPVSISSIVSDGVNLAVDTTGLGTQTYTSSLQINAFNTQFNIPFTIIVTSGTTPPTNITINNLPTCSLTNNILSLNNSYSLICSNIQPDITIQPFVDNAFIIGTGVSKTSSQFIWTFQPVQRGNTNITANFFNQGSPIGLPFIQQVKIQSAGSTAAGTKLSLLFTPSLNQADSNDLIAVQVVDNSSQSLVTNANLIVNAVAAANQSSGIAYIKFLNNVSYNIRATASGYDDFVGDFALTSKSMDISINPLNADSSTSITINTSTNATLFIDGLKVTNPYVSFLSAGTHEVQASADGYLDTFMNVTIKEAITATLQTELKTNVEQSVLLSKNTTWFIDYKADATSPETHVSQGTGTVATFTPQDTGIYTLYATDGKVITQYELKGWDGKIFGISWVWWGVGILILAGVIWWLRGRNSTGDLENQFQSDTNY